MRVLITIWAICVLATEESKHFLHLSLFHDETALFGPRDLFDTTYFDLLLNPSETPNVQLLQNATIVPISETEVEEERHLGPTQSVQGEQFFTMVTAHSLQVWGAAGLELQKLWEIEGPVHSLTPVSMEEFVGFVFVHSLRLCALDLQIRPIAPQCFPGLELPESSRVVVCQRLHLAATVHIHFGIMTIQQYQLDFQHMAILSLTPLNLDLERGEVMNGLCTSSFFFLQAHGVYLINETGIQFLKLPTLSLPYTLLKAIPNSDAVYAVSEDSVAVVGKKRMQVLPETIQVLAFAQQLVYVTTNHSVCVRDQADSRISDTQSVLIETANSEYQWMQSNEFGLLLAKAGKKLRLYLVELDPVLVAISGKGAPYTVEICNRCANCVAVAVEPAAGDAGTIHARNSSDVININQPLEGMHSSFTLDFSEHVSGVNLNATFVFDRIPPGFNASIAPLAESYAKDIAMVYHHTVKKAELLCATFINQVPQVAIRVENSILGYPMMNQKVDLLLELTACSYFEKDLYIYGEAEGRMWLYRQREFNIEQMELSEANDTLLRMVSTATHIILLFAARADILHVSTGRWQTFKSLSGFIGLCQDQDTLVLLSHDAIEFLVSIGGLYIPRAKTTTGFEIKQCGYSGATLVLLSASDTLTVYHVSSFRFLERYTHSADCHVTDMALGAYFCVYRCSAYYQVIHLDTTKVSSAILRIPTLQDAALMNMDDTYFIQIALKENELVIQKWNLHRSKELRYEVTVNTPEHAKISMPVELIGALHVTNSAGTERNFVVHITLENYGAVLSQPMSSNEVKVQWELTLTPSHYFSGHDLRFSADATDPTATVTVQQPLTLLNSLPIVATQFAIAVSLQHHLVFTFQSHELTVNKYQCWGEVCRVISRYYFSLNLSVILRLEVVCNAKGFVYLLVHGKYFITGTESENEVILYSLNPQTMKLSTFLHKKYATSVAVHTIKASETLYHLFLYGNALSHCTLRIPAAFSCTEVSHRSLWEIVSVGSLQLDISFWEVYAITESHHVITMKLTDSLSVVSDLLECAIQSESILKIVGNTLIVSFSKSLLIYSISNSILTKRATFFQRFQRNIETCVYDSMDNLLVVVKELSSNSAFIDVNSGFIVKEVKGVILPTEGNDITVSYFNQSLRFLRLSAGAVTVKQGRESSIAVVVSASNELSEGSVQVRIVWEQLQYWWVAVLIGAILCASLQCRRRALQRAEVEMQAINIEKR